MSTRARYRPWFRDVRIEPLATPASPDDGAYLFDIRAHVVFVPGFRLVMHGVRPDARELLRWVREGG